MKEATFGLVCLLSIAVASCARHDRACAVKVACILSVNWLLFNMPWFYPPASYAYLVGYPARQEDGWALFDLVSLMFAVWACLRVWWAPVIWATYLNMLAMHAVAYTFSLQYVDYAAVLDAGLAVQLAVIFMVGGPGCADRLSACWDRIRFVGRASGWLPEASS
ncbi:MAG: hypothetical protein PGN16_04130 [Sphingomonas phyllosphaerae]|uniref:hypothetical protein n=1 Tax=Sphingomonas phyllosphaerae TaxID=257003 RepID=UPI002FFB48F5